MIFLPFGYDQKERTAPGVTEWIFWEMKVPNDLQQKCSKFSG